MARQDVGAGYQLRPVRLIGAGEKIVYSKRSLYGLDIEEDFATRLNYVNSPSKVNMEKKKVMNLSRFASLYFEK